MYVHATMTRSHYVDGYAEEEAVRSVSFVEGMHRLDLGSTRYAEDSGTFLDPSASIVQLSSDRSIPN